MLKIILLFTFFSLLGLAQAPCSEADLKLAEDFQTQVQRRIDARLLTSSSLYEAELSVIEMKHCTQKFDNEEYCRKKGAILEKILGQNKNKMERGMLNTREYALDLKRLVEFRVFCSSR